MLHLRVDESTIAHPSTCFSKPWSSPLHSSSSVSSSPAARSIREDRAKYLYNLDVNSAYYDPKTRSMREAPNPGADPNTGAYMGDNFIRYSGETPAQQEQMVWAIKAADKGQDVHELAAPSQAMMAHEEFKRRKTELKAKTQNGVR